MASRAIVLVFLLPIIGMPSEYVNIFFSGAVLIGGLFESMSTILRVVTDIEKNGTLRYELSLPCSRWPVILKLLFSHTLRVLFSSLIFLVLGKILMWNLFDLSAISIPKLLVALGLTGILTGVLALFYASFICDVSDISFVWRSGLYPFLIIGGNLFPWRAVDSFSPIVGKLFLLNPIMLASEAIRVSLLGPNGYLPFWVSGVGLLFCSFVFGIFGFIQLKKRLDMF